MELDNAPASRKRTVDADNPESEVSDPKRPKINLDSGTKGKIIGYIVESAIQIYELLEIVDSFGNITASHQIMSILQGGHNILRKMANFRISTHPNLALSATVTIGGSSYNKTYEEITTLMKGVATTAGLEYTQSNRADNNHWYGIANPIFNILSAFKMRFDEIRIGVSRIPVGKRGETTDYVDVSQYGLTPAHHVLLEGSTYKPERRSAMAQTVGPLTSLLAAYKSRDPYRNKWVEAVKRDLVHIPNALNLCNSMQGKRAEEVAPALSAFADVVLLAGSRNAQRAFFPLCFVMFAVSTPEQLVRLKATRRVAAMGNAVVDFSGKGMWNVYKMCCGQPWKMETAMDDVLASQVVYHSIFGTQNEDLGVLQAVTSVKSPWKLRSEIADKFRSQGKALKAINLPTQLLYAKMAQANMTGMLTESAFQIRSKQVFAGKRVVNYIDAFYKHMSSDTPQAIQGGMTLHALAAFYRSLKVELMTKKEESPIHGTVEWREMAGLTIANHGAISPIVVRESGRYFCERS